MPSVLDGVGDTTQQVPEADVRRHRFIEYVHCQGERPRDALDGLVAPRLVDIAAITLTPAHQIYRTKRAG